VKLLVVIAVFGALALNAPASAQSRRYPPRPVDKDAEAAGKSELWNAAITPERHPYLELVRAAAEALARRTPDQTAEALAKLDQAIQLMPREPDAYRLRGDAQFERRAWAACAADLAAADAHARRDDEPVRTVTELRRKLGLCQARAGKLGDAEKTLAELAASGNAGGEIWMRLGEVRIAMGKLDEAIAALRSALDGTDQASQALIHFMLAAAYDRGRRPADALDEAATGVKLDPQLAVLRSPALPPLGDGELDYMLGLGYSAEPPRPEPPRPEPPHPENPRPEYALAAFHRFVAAAPASPWRKRAEEHIRDLRTMELPERLARGGTAQLDLEAARTIVRRAMPAMRACVASDANAVVEVDISRAGPRTPVTDKLRPRFFTPPDGVAVRRSVGELSERGLQAIDRCIQPLAARLALPPVKERDTYYKITFYVVGP